MTEDRDVPGDDGVLEIDVVADPAADDGALRDAIERDDESGRDTDATNRPIRRSTGVTRSAAPPKVRPAAAPKPGSGLPPGLPGWDTITKGTPIDASPGAVDTAQPPVLPPSIAPGTPPPERDQRGSAPHEWETAEVSPVAPSEVPPKAWRVQAKSPRPVAAVSGAVPAVAVAAPIPEPVAPVVAAVPERRRGWRWWQFLLFYLVLTGLAAAAGWQFWMWFARDELANQQQVDVGAMGQLDLIHQTLSIMA